MMIAPAWITLLLPTCVYTGTMKRHENKTYTIYNVMFLKTSYRYAVELAIFRRLAHVCFFHVHHAVKNIYKYDRSHYSFNMDTGLPA